MQWQNLFYFIYITYLNLYFPANASRLCFFSGIFRSHHSRSVTTVHASAVLFIPFFPISTNFTIPVFLIKYHLALLVSTPPGFFLAFPTKFGNFIHLTRFSYWFFPLLFHKMFDKQVHENHQRPKVPQHSKSRNSHYLRSHVCGADNTGADQKCHDPKTKHDVPD